MIMQLAKKSATLHATGNLIREGIKTEFKYETINARNYTVSNPNTGYMRIQAGTSVLTRDELHFVIGDIILLEEQKTPLRIGNISKKVNEKQYMFLQTSTQVEYTLDLQ